MRFFAAQDSLSTLVLPIHNAAIAGDTLTSINFNFKWRKLVASALYYYFQHLETTLGLDNEDLLDDLLIDLYNLEATSAMAKVTVYRIAPTANATTSSTSFVAIASTLITHTFSKPNAHISFSNLALFHSAASAPIFTQIRMGGTILVTPTAYEVTGTTVRALRLGGVLANIAAGGETVQIYWRVSSGTGTLSIVTDIILEIHEWDD